MANHTSTRTTQLYERRSYQVSLDEIEQVRAKSRLRSVCISFGGCEVVGALGQREGVDGACFQTRLPIGPGARSPGKALRQRVPALL